MGIKHAVGAQRPGAALHLVAKDGPTFPSGHVTYTLALVGIVALIVGRDRGRRTHAALAAATVAVAITVAGTRLYLGVHWLTDVVGGALLAVVAVVSGWAAYHAAGSGRPRYSGVT